MNWQNEKSEMFLYYGNYSPEIYWERRLGKYFDLVGSGCVNLGPYYNAQLYKARLQALERGMSFVGRSFYGSAVLEAGCGTGFYTEYCARRGVRSYTGIDITQTSVYSLQKRFPYFEFIQADISANLPSTLGNFDIVLAPDIMFHIIPDDAFERAIRNLLFHLKPGGLFIVSDLFPSRKIHLAPHVCFHSVEEYVCLFSQNGLYVSHQEPIFFILYPLPLIFFLFGNNPQEGGNRFWRCVRKMVRWGVFDRVFPLIASWLDRRVFLPLITNINEKFLIPTMKWLFAIKRTKNGEA